MTKIMITISIVLTICAVFYAGTLLWVNVFAKCVTNLDSKNEGMLKGIKNSMIVSMIGILLSCFLADYNEVASAIAGASNYYRSFSLIWFTILVAAMLVRLYSFAMKKTLKEESKKAFVKLYTVSVWGIIIGIVLARLLA